MSRRILLLVLAVSAVALSGCDVAFWRMDETSGQRMNDSVGNHPGLTSNVTVGVAGQDGKAYSFNGTSSMAAVPDSSDLDPGTANFSFGAWIKTSVLPPPLAPDVIRKGVTDSAGGYYKLELFTVNGSARARCYFEDASNVGVTAGGGNNLSNGQWHQLSCARSGNTYTLTIDGAVAKTATGSLGSISNADNLTIGYKSPSGDYYAGLVDDAKVSVG